MDHIHAVEKVREAAGLKENRPVGDRSRLLHGTQARLILLLKLCFMQLRLVQLLLLFRDQEAVLLNLRVVVVDRFIRQLDLAVDVRFLLHNALRLLFILRDLCRQRRALFLDARLLLAELLKLCEDLLRLGGTHRSQQPRRHAEYRQKREQRAKDAEAMGLAIGFHGYTLRNFRMESKLPTTPTAKPVSAYATATSSTTSVNGTT